MEKQTFKTESNAAYIKTLETTVQQQKEEILRLQQKLERMNELLLNAQRAQFGQSSEKRGYVLPDSEQMRIFNEAEQAQDEKAEEPTEKTLVAAHERKKKRTNAFLTEGLPTKDVFLELPEEERTCPTCGSDLEVVPIGGI